MQTLTTLATIKSALSSWIADCVYIDKYYRFDASYIAQFNQLIGQFEDHRIDDNLTPYSPQLKGQDKLVDLLLGIVVNAEITGKNQAIIAQIFLNKARELLAQSLL